MTTVSEPLANARDMITAHAMFRREFGLMPGLVRSVAAGDKQRATLVADHVALVSAVVSEHHSGEDMHIWPRLRERCPGDCASLSEVMEDQHRAIYDALLQVKRAEETWRASASAQSRDALAEVIAGLLPVTREHLDLEEECVVPLIEKYVTEAEYACMAQDQAAHIPRDKLTTVFGMIMYEGDPAVIGMIVTEMPVEVQPVVKALATRAYAVYARDLYGTAAPPRMTG
jgi:hemerythrin-like domain-containing protein